MPHNIMKKPIYFLAFVLLFLLSGIRLNAQTNEIKGVIRLSEGGDPLPNIFVFLKNTHFDAMTNGRGRFVLKNIPMGKYTLIASSVGYFPIEEEIVVSKKEMAEIKLEMEEEVMDLPSAVVKSISLTGGLGGLKDIPGSATYISPQEIQKFNYTDINRTLRSVPGVNLQEEDGFGLRPNIGLRGSGSERSSKITLMEDGVLSAPAPYAAPAAYYFPTIGRIQAVEILKGSSQIRFGPYTTGGAVNLISTAIPRKFSGRIHLLGGSFGSRNLHAFAGDSQRNFGYLVETYQYKSNGFKDLDNKGNTGFDKKDYLVKFRLNTGPTARIYQSLTFKIGQTTETSNETYLGLTQADFNQNPFRRYAGSQKDQMKTNHEQYSMRHIAQFSKSLDLTTTFYRNEFHRNWFKLDKVINSSGEKIKISNLLENPKAFPEAFGVITGTTSLNEDALQVKANNRTYLSQGIQTVLGIRLGDREISHNIDIGLRYHFDQIDRFQWVDGFQMKDGIMHLTQSGVHGTESNRIQSAKAFATYVQYKLKVGGLSVIPGLRYENIRLHRRDYGNEDPERTAADLSERRNQEGVFIPGIGVDYKFNTYLNLFAGVHRGFSPPGTKQGSKPEKSINYELGFRYNKGGLSGQTAFFFNDYSNLLGTDLAAAGGSGSSDLFNGGEVETKGIEFQLTYDLLSGKERDWTLPVSVVYTFTNATFQNSFESTFEGWGNVKKGDQLPYLANHQLSLALSLTHKKFSFNISGRYQDAMRTKAGQGPIPENERTDSYFVVDTNAGYALHQNITLFGSITNLTDKVYAVARRPAGLRPGMPRAFMAGLKVDF